MGPTVAMRPKLMTTFEPIPEQYPIREYRGVEQQRPNKISKPALRTMTTQSSPVRSVPATTSAYPMYPGLQISTATPPRKTESKPMVLNRPRKLAGTSASGAQYGPIRDRKMSLSSNWSVADRNEQLDAQAWAQQILRRPSTAGSIVSNRPASRGLQPNELFATLPDEILDTILENLKDLHLAPNSDSCATCWMRDLCSLAVTSRRWCKVARFSMYRDIQLVGPDSASHKKRFKMAQGCRMTLLRRTLRENQRLGALVRTLKVPMLDTGLASAIFARGDGSPIEQYDNKVAALVMACPNLERLAGPITSYDHSFHRIFHALSTRTKLKSMDWRIEAVAGPEGCRPDSSCSAAALPAELTSAQATVFLDHHRGWTNLQSLSIHCLPGASLAQGHLLERTLTCLPSLKHLHLSCLPANTFNDSNLLSLPKLETLTLSHIAGITSAGLSSFATKPNSQHLRALHLRHSPLTALPALARLFSHLHKLTNFSLVQDFSPMMPEEDCFSLWMMPYLASPSLVKLHWDITCHMPGSVNDADDILSRSIAAGGFPNLRSIRTPNDARGAFQALCRPLEYIASASDRVLHTGSSAVSLRSASSLSSKSPIKTLSRSATVVSLPTTFAPPPPHGTDLRSARIAAQSRINAERQFKHRFQVHVFDEEGSAVENFTMGGYIGTLGSQIEYCLQPDPGSSDDKGGLFDVPDLAADGGEFIAPEKEGCTGSWNWREGVIADRREKEKWWHTERGRWQDLRLE